MIAKLKRRAILGFAMATVTLAGMAGVITANAATNETPAAEPIGQMKIDDGRDVGWDISSGSKGYNNMIEGLRQRATGGLVLRDGMLQTDPNSNEIFTINVTGSQVQGAANAVVRLIVRARDLYIVGWHVQNPVASIDAIYALEGYPETYHGPDGATPVRTTGLGANYGSLENTAQRRRDATLLSPEVMNQAFLTLTNGAPDPVATARAVLAFAMTVAEAARYDALQNLFAPIFDGANVQVTSAETDLMNNWGKYSKAVLDNLNNAVPLDIQIRGLETEVPIREYKAQTLLSIAAIIAVVLLSPVGA